MTLNSACLASGLLLLVLLACNVSKNVNTNNKNVTKSDPDVRVLGTFTNRRNVVNNYILVEKGISNDKLVELAKKLHRAEPEANFWFVDDDFKSEEMIQWVKAYEKGDAAATDPIFDWMGDHIVATYNNISAKAAPNTGHWQKECWETRS